MAHDQFPIRQCNLCGEKERIQFLFLKNGYHIVKCGQCSLTYTNEIPTNEDLAQIYSANFFNRGNKFNNVENNTHSVNSMKRLERIQTLPKIKCGHWLDVGCATGEFMAAAATLVNKIDGIEFSQYAARQAISRYGLNVITGDFLEADLEPSQYDLVTAWDFIEHVIDPMKTIKKLLGLLKPGGYLILTTGDINTFSAKLTGKFWHLMIPPRHMYYFSAGTIRQYVNTAQANLHAIKYYGKHISLDFALWKLVDQVSQPASKKVLPLAQKLRLGRWSPEINLHDIMEVTIQKPRPA